MRIAIPSIISNITVPIMGIATTAIAGHIGDDSALMIGELAIGTSIFNLIYWTSSFIRMGTSGLTAQAYGRGDFTETTSMLIRSIVISLVLSLVMVLFQNPISEAGVAIMNGGEIALEYTKARIWALPAGIMLFAFHGWFNGMQNAMIPMVVAILVNTLHVAISFVLANSYDMGVVGIAYASVVSQWVGVVVSVALLMFRYRKTFKIAEFDYIFGMSHLKEFFLVNRDVVIRTICTVAVYITFTAFSARMGSANILAANSIMMELFFLFAYMSDGFAYAAEALIGRFVGANDKISLISCVKKCMRWSLIIGVAFVAVYFVCWRDLINMFMSEGEARQEVAQIMSGYIWWIMVIPILGSVPFMLDGVLVGASITDTMRNSMVLSTFFYFVMYYLMLPIIGNDALWGAFAIQIVIRGIYLYVRTNRLNDVYEKAIK